MSQEQKDFTSVSPSARSLLLMKGYTDIPFARETAALMQGPEVFGLNFDNKDFWFWIRVMHFEARYWSIDQLLKQASIKNILELSSGYSLRCLDLCLKDPAVHCIDTDLSGVVAAKRTLIAQLEADKNVKGKFELLPLNALNEQEFEGIVDHFGKGELSIVNEGLLMYLDIEEKKRLCRIIHTVLKQRGGCWITADVYIRRSAEMQASIPQSKGETTFFEQHNIEGNKFESYLAAGGFFEDQGFEVVHEAVINYQALSVMPHLLKVLPKHVKNNQEPPPKVQATWMLRAV